VIRDSAAVVVGFFVGVLSGTMGIGGGVLMVPILALGFGLRQHVAQGTSLVAIIPTSLVGSVTHHRYGNLLLRAALWMGAAGAVGAALGALMALQLPKGVLARLFGAFLLFSAYRLWPWKPGRRPAGETQQ
jgi:uncharacterized membrane protein YfcA